jgi:hydroxymethylglutaryl-CoA reductase
VSYRIDEQLLKQVIEYISVSHCDLPMGVVYNLLVQLQNLTPLEG